MKTMNQLQVSSIYKTHFELKKEDQRLLKIKIRFDLNFDNILGKDNVVLWLDQQITIMI